MPSELERLSVAETSITTIREDLGRMRLHIGELLTFKSKLEGGMGMVKWLTGLGLLSNLAMLLKIFLG